jgi:hypothetical protein
VRPFGKTRAAAEYAALHALADLTRARAAVVLRELAACETALAGGNGRPPAAASAALLRGLVIAVRDLAGPAWLEASADDPGRGRVRRDAGDREPAGPRRGRRDLLTGAVGAVQPGRRPQRGHRVRHARHAAAQRERPRTPHGGRGPPEVTRVPPDATSRRLALLRDHVMAATVRL